MLAGSRLVLALVAQAAWLGTRFLLAKETPLHEKYRRRVIAAVETDPHRYANLYEVGGSDVPHRAVHNSTTEAWEAAAAPRQAADPEKASGSRAVPPASRCSLLLGSATGGSLQWRITLYQCSPIVQLVALELGEPVATASG